MIKNQKQNNLKINISRNKYLNIIYKYLNT